MKRFSVVIPTHQRRKVVRRSVATLAEQSFTDFDVTVVVDGSTDGTASDLRSLSLPFPLAVLEQANAGAAAARNAGADESDSEILLFLDDDMAADPALLEEHDRSHRQGADLVLGDVPLDPDSPPSLLSSGVGLWSQERRRRLTEPGAELGLGDLLTGQLSISREAFDRLGGFDVSLTREGLFGGEDIDFGYRAQKLGLKIVFNPAAISRQYYAVDPDAYLRRSFEVGRSQRELAMKHPEHAAAFAEGPKFHTRKSKLLLGPLVVLPEAFSRPLRRRLVTSVRGGRDTPRLRRLFFGLRTTEHLRGERRTRAALATGSFRTLAYHAIEKAPADDPAGRWSVAPARFGSHLRALRRCGFRFVSLTEISKALRGEARLPRRAILVTFDDAYVDLLTEAAPRLQSVGAPAVVFAVAGLTGGSNEWDRGIGAAPRALLDEAGLREAVAAGTEVGSHSETHPELRKVSTDQLQQELVGSAEKIEAMGLPRPRAFCYPYGDCDERVARAVADAGYEMAFTIWPGVCNRASDRYMLPRIEVLRDDSSKDLILKLLTASFPDRVRRALLRRLGVEL